MEPVLRRRLGTGDVGMTTLTGGLRLRLVRDSALNAVVDGLTAQGWFDAGRRHRPVTVTAEPVGWEEPVEPNLLTVVVNALDSDYLETGSNFMRDTLRVVVDLYAESDTLGMELANDIRDLLRGRLGAAVTRSALPIWDYRLATPAVIAFADVDNVAVSRSIAVAQQSWRRYWFTIAADLYDAYYTADDTVAP
jgi:hypothetical protein